jgi:RNA polymerase sigma-70 factor (ECF subfamily)
MDRLKRLLEHEKVVNWEKEFATALPRIMNYFRFHGVENLVAEDLTASTFEKAWRKRQSYLSEKSKVSTWLFTIAHHTMIDYFRTRIKELPLDILEDRPERLVSNSPEEAAQRSDDKECLRRILLALPERERELIALKYGAEMTNRAIAKQTGLSETNIGTILNRVIKALHTQMEDEK